MLKPVKMLQTLCLAGLMIGTVHAQDASPDTAAEAPSPYQYLSLGDDIVTNYQTPGHHLGFLRVSVNLMVANPAAKEKVMQHEPQIRDALIWMLSTQDEAHVKSLNLREETRKRCLDKINGLLQAELGEKPVIDVLFTSYVYQ